MVNYRWKFYFLQGLLVSILSQNSAYAETKGSVLGSIICSFWLDCAKDSPPSEPRQQSWPEMYGHRSMRGGIFGKEALFRDFSKDDFAELKRTVELTFLYKNDPPYAVEWSRGYFKVLRKATIPVVLDYGSRYNPDTGTSTDVKVTESRNCYAYEGLFSDEPEGVACEIDTRGVMWELLYAPNEPYAKPEYWLSKITWE